MSTLTGLADRRSTRRRRPSPGEARWDGKVWRRWSGKRWSRALHSVDPARLLDPRPLDADPELTDESRARLLAAAVDHQVLHNRATVVHVGASGTVLAYRVRFSPVPHALLTLLTGGLWGLVWLGLVLSRLEDRVLVDCDAWGHVWPVAFSKR